MALPALDPATQRIIVGYSDQVRAVRERVGAFVRLRWGALGAFRDTDIERFVAAILPTVAGGQRQLAALTDGYLTAIAAAVLGTPQRPIGVPSHVVSTETMRGVPAVDVYKRAGVTVWTALSNGKDLDTAAGMGMARALVIAQTDLQLARTHATRYVATRNDNIVGYSRIPEANACELCLLASTQRYHAGDLMPIHDRCSCDVEPLFGEADPGQIIDPELLNRLNADDLDGARRMFDERVAIEEHGELGPVLTFAGQTFTGPHDLH